MRNMERIVRTMTALPVGRAGVMVVSIVVTVGLGSMGGQRDVPAGSPAAGVSLGRGVALTCRLEARPLAGSNTGVAW